MIKLDAPIIPYEGIGDIKLYSCIDDIVSLLKNTNTPYTSEIWKLDDDEEDGPDPDPWTIIIIDNIAKLYFASNNILFKIIVLPDYKGTLLCKISATSTFSEAFAVDPTLKFDDWNEIYKSDKGYFMETDSKDEEILNLSIFIKEMETSAFENYEWQRSFNGIN